MKIKTSTTVAVLFDVLKIANQRFNNVRNLASDKRLYLDDIYHCLDKSYVSERIKERKIYEKSDSFIYSEVENSSF